MTAKIAREVCGAPFVLTAYPELDAEDVRRAMQYAACVVSDQIVACSA